MHVSKADNLVRLSERTKILKDFFFFREEFSHTIRKHLEVKKSVIVIFCGLHISCPFFLRFPCFFFFFLTLA